MNHPMKSNVGRQVFSGVSVLSLMALPLGFAFWQASDSEAIAELHPRSAIADSR